MEEPAGKVGNGKVGDGLTNNLPTPGATFKVNHKPKNLLSTYRLVDRIVCSNKAQGWR